MMMTNEQTIAVFKNMIRSNNEYGNTLLTIGEVQALNLAIEALSNSQNQTDSALKTTTGAVSEADVIYRQDAINMTVEILADATTCMMPKDLWREVVTERISKLPSAQPESRCNTCRYTNLEWYEEPCDSCTMGGESNHYKPSAQRTGEWIDRSEGGRILNPWWESHKCDQCGYFGSGAWNYCPYCGSHNGSEL